MLSERLPMNDLLFKIASQPQLAFVPGWMEMAIVLVVIMLLFGNRLPGTMRSLGQSLVQFKKGLKEGDEEGSDKLQ
jgi:sec-independent protein translocase protein TatA